MFYFVKTPQWIQSIFPRMIWKIKTEEKCIYPTFDDGPHPIHTAFVLDELKKYNAKATFFCIGKNVRAYPEIYRRIIDEGHVVGNHTYNHLNGKKTIDKAYVENIMEAAKVIDSNLFRPPYGSIKSFQAKIITTLNKPFTIIMWTVLSGDFDVKLSPQRCLENVLLKTEKGSIVVFHDSDKAAERMNFALPIFLKHFNEKEFSFKKLPNP